MIFRETKIGGAFVLDLERREDERGYFARTWCQKEFAARGLNAHVAQINVSRTEVRGTLRGMHFQHSPFAEAKTVSCTRGAIYDVVLDLRLDSPTYLQWDAAELTDDNRRMLHIPAGCAHGFQTLSAGAEVLYFMSQFYSPEHADGVRYDDKAVNIHWPLDVTTMSPADQQWPDYRSRSSLPGWTECGNQPRRLDSSVTP